MMNWKNLTSPWRGFLLLRSVYEKLLQHNTVNTDGNDAALQTGGCCIVFVKHTGHKTS
jgi:hypothetical protein